MKASPVWAVVRFETLRTLQKPQFWFAALLMPVLFGIVLGAVAWSSQAAPTENASDSITFEYSDSAGVISQKVAQQLGGSRAAEPSSAIADVKAGRLDAFFSYPAGGTGTVTVYAKDLGVFNNSAYSHVAQALFGRSVDERIGSAELVDQARSGVTTSLKTFDGDSPAAGLGAVIPLAILVLLLVLVIGLLGNQMLNSTVEEKENRVSEMLLVSLSARALLRGKMIALSLVGMVQIAVVLVPSLVLLKVFGSSLSLDGLKIDAIVVDPLRMLAGLLVLFGGLLLVASGLVLLGTVMPSAREAAPYYSVVVLSTIAPLYLVTTLMVNPHGLVAEILTYIPVFAAATTLTRNAVGGIDLWQALLVAVELWLLSAIQFRFATAVFQKGALSYGSRLSLRKALSTRASTKA